jgi:hypothetical protein
MGLLHCEPLRLLIEAKMKSVIRYTRLPDWASTQCTHPLLKVVGVVVERAVGARVCGGCGVGAGQPCGGRQCAGHGMPQVERPLTHKWVPRVWKPGDQR